MTATYELVCQMKSYIQPFERILALKELEALASALPVPQNSNTDNSVYSVVTQHSPVDLAARLAYWEQIGLISENQFSGIITCQARREATSHLVKNGSRLEQLREQLPFSDKIPLPRHRNLRYGTHGIHEYRGKFFPQLVLSLLNIAGADENSIILDPMCGSGTTLVEANLLGCQAIGVDLNPLSVLMSQAKCDILSLNPDRLLAEYQSLRADLLINPSASPNGLSWFNQLPQRDQDYLSRWFAPQVLTELDPIATRVHNTTDPTCRAMFKVSLSNILRSVSWQKNDDLRVRKDKHSITDVDVQTLFLNELERSTKAVLALLYENQGCKVGKSRIVEGDIRLINKELGNIRGCVDIIITSPPYATALPYLDTDRLSLCYLGLLSRPHHRSHDRDMIGNREITNGQRQGYWEEYYRRRNELPGEITKVVDRIDELNNGADVGFRRRNKAALLARYFLDMRKVFENLHFLLRPNAPLYVVVGNNYTVAGGQRVDIETNKLLASLGEFIGFTLEETISMDMLVSRDIFKKNTGSAETILAFRNYHSIT
jgi:SAM-dependent methyltransferase